MNISMRYCITIVLGNIEKYDCMWLKDIYIYYVHCKLRVLDNQCIIILKQVLV